MKTKIATLAMLMGSVLPGWGYSVTLNIDNSQAVNVYSDDVAVSVTDGDNEVAAEQLILVTVNEGYAFTRADDLNTGLSYLNYDRQKTPIYIRAGIFDGEEVNEADGHTIVIETLDESTLQTYSMEVNVDDASKVIFKVGPTSEFYSSYNIEIPLDNGANTVTYTEGARYIHVTATTFLTEFYSVQVNGHEVKQYGYIYTWPIPTGDVRVDIVVKDPNGTGTSVTTLIDDQRSEIIYNLQGLQVGKGEDLQTLPAGIYIIDGKKVTKK